MAKIEADELARRINGYLKRARRDDIQIYRLRERGLYTIYGGCNDNGRGEIGIYNGRYIDVLVEAVKNSSFLGDWCSWDLPDNCNHGYVEKVNPEKPERVKKISNDLIAKIKLGGKK